ncbi:hypothetical protein [Roseburia inulinivorans]
MIKRIVFKPSVLGEDIDAMMVDVHEVSAQLNALTNSIQNSTVFMSDCDIVLSNVKDVLSILWVDSCSVGHRKNDIKCNAFQAFFVALHKFLLQCRDSENLLLQALASRALYQGVLYRFLVLPDKVHDVEYNDVYVSWSKRDDNVYFSKHIHGYGLWLSCDVRDDYWGIDLSAFDIDKNDEQEVVFPMVEELAVRCNRSHLKSPITVPKLIDDGRRALDANASFAGLCVAFALVDECAGVEWRHAHGCERSEGDNEKSWIEWYDMWFTAKGCKPEDKALMIKFEKERRKHCLVNGKARIPQLDGHMLYKIRCAFLHAMSGNVDFSKSGDAANRGIEDFSVMISKPSFLMDGTCAETDGHGHNKISIDVGERARELLHLVEQYYNEHDPKDFNIIVGYDFTGLYVPECKY